MTSPNAERVSPGEQLKDRMMGLIRSELFSSTIAVAANNAIEIINNSGLVPEPYINTISRNRAVENLQAISQSAALQFRGLDGSWLRRINDITDITLLDLGKQRRREFQFPMHIAITCAPAVIKQLEDRKHVIEISMAGSALKVNIPENFYDPTFVLPINMFRQLTSSFNDPRLSGRLDDDASPALSNLIDRSILFRSPREEMRLNQQLSSRRPY